MIFLRMCTVNVPPPQEQWPPLNPESDDTAWRKWRRSSEAYGRNAGIRDKGAEDRNRHLVTWLEFEALDINEALPFAEDSKHKDLQNTLGYLENYFVGEQNVIYNLAVQDERPGRQA